MVLKDTKIGSYAMIYGAAYLGLDMLYQWAGPYLKYDSSLLAYMGCLGGAAFFTSTRFQKKHRRTFSPRETRRLTHLALLITSLVTLVDTLVVVGRMFGFQALKTPLETFDLTIEYPALLAAILLGFVLFTYGLLRVCFGYLSSWRFATAVKRGHYPSPAVTK